MFAIEYSGMTGCWEREGTTGGGCAAAATAAACMIALVAGFHVARLIEFGSAA